MLSPRGSTKGVPGSPWEVEGLAEISKQLEGPCEYFSVDNTEEDCYNAKEAERYNSGAS